MDCQRVWQRVAERDDGDDYSMRCQQICVYMYACQVDGNENPSCCRNVIETSVGTSTTDVLSSPVVYPRCIELLVPTPVFATSDVFVLNFYHVSES